MGHIHAGQNGRGVVRVHVADEFGLHLQGAVYFGPVLQGNVQGAGSEVRTADTNLHGRGEGLTRLIDEFAGMDFVGEFRRPLLLGDVEFPLVDAFIKDVLTELAAAQLMEHQPLFAGVDHFAVVECGVFFN